MREETYKPEPSELAHARNRRDLMLINEWEKEYLDKSFVGLPIGELKAIEYVLIMLIEKAEQSIRLENLIKTQIPPETGIVNDLADGNDMSNHLEGKLRKYQEDLVIVRGLIKSLES